MENKDIINFQKDLKENYSKSEYIKLLNLMKKQNQIMIEIFSNSNKNSFSYDEIYNILSKNKEFMKIENEIISYNQFFSFLNLGYEILDGWDNDEIITKIILMKEFKRLKKYFINII